MTLIGAPSSSQNHLWRTDDKGTDAVAHGCYGVLRLMRRYSSYSLCTDQATFVIHYMETHCMMKRFAGNRTMCFL